MDACMAFLASLTPWYLAAIASIGVTILVMGATGLWHEADARRRAARAPQPPPQSPGCPHA